MPKRPADELPRGAMRAILLSLLADRPSHGYALVQALQKRTNGALTLKEGTLYPALHELEADGLIDASWETSPEGRKRRIYSLTPRGRKEAASWRDRWLAMADLLRDLLVVPHPKPAR